MTLSAINRFLLSVFMLVVSVGAQGAWADTTAVQHVNPGYGYVKEEAIEVCKPLGQREYLGSLQCSDGMPPTFKRIGNFGPRHEVDIPDEELATQAQQRELEARLIDINRVLAPGEVDIHIVDGYEVDCRDRKVTLFLDMYHCSQPKPEFAPAGFGIMK
ncbi:MAG: hypothetical protein ACRCWR_05145 [Saezia sp.]